MNLVTENEKRLWLYRNSQYEQTRVGLVESAIAEAFPADSRVLEIGPGLGVFTEMLLRNGCKPTLYEPDPQRVAHLRTQPGITPEMIVADTFPPARAEHNPATESFDGALVLEVIEHVPEPELLLRDIATALKPGGTLLLSTPNRTSMEAQVHLLKYWLGGQVYNAGDPTHLWLFSASKITRLLTKAGFKVRRMTSMHFGCGDQRGGKIPGMPIYFDSFKSSSRWPLNRLGFNLLITAEKQ